MLKDVNLWLTGMILGISEGKGMRILFLLGNAGSLGSRACKEGL
jgi:hypothetical protein